MIKAKSAGCPNLCIPIIELPWENKDVALYDVSLFLLKPTYDSYSAPHCNNYWYFGRCDMVGSFRFQKWYSNKNWHPGFRDNRLRIRSFVSLRYTHIALLYRCHWVYFPALLRIFSLCSGVFDWLVNRSNSAGIVRPVRENMEYKTKEEVFMQAVDRVNRYLVIMGIFFLIYFLIITKADKFLFLLALSNVSFALLSHRLLNIARGLSAELRQTRVVLKEYAEKVAKLAE